MSSLAKVVAPSNQELNETLAKAIDYVQMAAIQGVCANEAEQNILVLAWTFGRQLLSAFFAKQGDGDLGETLALPDGQILNRLSQRRERNYRSVLGSFKLLRAVYGSREGQAIDCVPLDTRLQLPAEEYSYLLQDWCQRLSVEVPYAKTREILKTTLSIPVSVDSLEHISRCHAEEVPAFREQQNAALPETEGELLVVSADGKGVPICHPKDCAPILEQKTRRGPKPDRKRMAVVGAVYTVDPYVRTPEVVLEALFQESDEKSAHKRPLPKNKRVVANLSRPVDGTEIKGSELTFAWIREQVEQRAAFKKTRVVLMDGQISLWEQRKQYLPGESWVEILDLLHANQYLWETASVFHPNDPKAQIIFMKDRVLRVLQGKVSAVIGGLRQAATKRGLSKKAYTTVEKVCSYLFKNRHRMRYHEYLAAGYPIASGVIEGACRHFVKDRLERAGMRWTIVGAQAMLDIRSTFLNGDWDVFTQYRIRRQTEKLYPYRMIIGKVEWPMAA